MTFAKRAAVLRWSALGLGLLCGVFRLLGAEGGPSTAELRTWTSADGKFHTQARLVEVRPDAVVLEKGDGARITVPRAKLGGQDLDYLARHAAAATPKTPAAAAQRSNAFLGRDYKGQVAQLLTRILMESYAKGGKVPHPRDTDARRLFEALALSLAHSTRSLTWAVPDIATRKDLHALAEKIRGAGCDDPLVFAIYATTGDPAHPDKSLAKPGQEALAAMRKRQDHPLLIVTFRTIAGGADVTLDAMAEAVVGMARQKDYPGVSRRLLFQVSRRLIQQTPGIHNEIYEELTSRTDFDPWFAAMLLGDREASQSKQGDDPAGHEKAARDRFRTAWKLHPENPEPAVQMMRLGDDSPGETARAWFDRAVAAEFDYEAAYIEMRRQLMDRGDPEQMHAFGLECLKTGRFDTDVPGQYLLVLQDIEKTMHSDDWWRRPDVRENVREFFRRSAADPTPRNLDFLASQAAYHYYRCGCFSEALEAFARAGDRLDRAYFKRFDLDPDATIAQCRAKAGPSAASFQQADQAAAAGHPEEAAKMMRDVVAKLDKADKGRTFARHRLVAAKIEAALAAGRWVNIQPDADLAGWTVACGDWVVDAQGGLVGTSDVTKVSRRDLRGMMLLCQAKVGSRFEVRGHAEIIKAHEDEGSFGAVIGYSDAQRYWQCYFYPPHEHREGFAYVLCSVHRNPHARNAQVARSDDFRVRVYDDRVVTTVGAETQAEQGPFAIMLDHDVPSDSTSFGVGGNRPFFGRPPNVVRFTKLELRKLTEPPPARKVVEPGANGAHIDR